MLNNTDILEKVKAKFPKAVLGSADRFGLLEILVDRDCVPALAAFLKADPSLDFNMLIDLVSLDYLDYPGWEGDRFAAAYLFKSLPRGHRVQLKAILPEDEPVVGTISGLFANANFLEREAWDQMGIKFAGHPNLKRLLNHHEFVGHPLRKDYPLKKRQWLSANESLMDEMDVRLKEKGWV